MSEWFNVKDVLPDPNTRVEVVFSFIASATEQPQQWAWPCTFHPEGSSPPMFVFHSWLGEYRPGGCGEIIAWRFPEAVK